MDETHNITDFLNQDGNVPDEKARNELCQRIMAELQVLAQARLRDGPISPLLDRDDLIHEIYTRLVPKRPGDAAPAETPRWEDRKHFYRAAAAAMRNLCIDHARRRQAQQQDSRMVVTDPRARQPESNLEREEKLLQLNAAIDALAQMDVEAAKLFELRYFGVRDPEGARPAAPPGAAPLPDELMPMSAAAKLLGWPRSTAYRAWARAMSRLRSYLADDARKEARP